MRRLSLIEAWTDSPDLVTANQGEPGIIKLSEHLLSRGVGIEAGLLTADDARKFVEWSGRDRCVRVLIEPLDADPEEAGRHAAAMERIVLDARRAAAPSPSRRWCRVMGCQPTCSESWARHTHGPRRYTRPAEWQCGVR